MLNSFMNKKILIIFQLPNAKKRAALRFTSCNVVIAEIKQCWDVNREKLMQAPAKDQVICAFIRGYVHKA